jgi:DNA polymerase III epsilon subunit-like protein
MRDDHFKAHSIRWLAIEFGIDRSTLGRRLAERFGTANRAFTCGEILDALTRRGEREAVLIRKLSALADKAELKVAKMKLELVEYQRRIFLRLVDQVNSVIGNSRSLSKTSRRQLLEELSTVRFFFTKPNK